MARLKLRPRFEMDATGIVRIDTAPVYDAPPTVDELYRAAAKNHELEAAYFSAADGRCARSEPTTTARGGSSVAEAFLADKGMRAASHPPPTPKTCYVITDRGGVLFDVSIDQGLAKDVPPEAHRRFRADRRAYQEQVRQDQIAQAALHEEKKQFIAEWISANGTEEEKARHASGVLPMAEAIARISDQVFAAVNTRPVYVHDGAQRLQSVHPAVSRARRTWSSHRPMSWPAAPTPSWPRPRSGPPSERFRSDCPRPTRCSVIICCCRGVTRACRAIVIIGALVTLKHGPFVLRREYIVSDRQSAAAPATEVDRH